MSPIVVRPLGTAPASTQPAQPDGVTERTVQVNGDPPTTVYVLDARRDSFGTDLAYVFGRTVSRAREENTRLTGNPDGIIG